ncbi:2-dehydro-3-deoxy-6-phosphogalactonate aldolase [bacterium HR40]|nr:2-dehydro-3-deoxy-6-phosphogalactonate aldolase [bacterium HR40]
MSDLRSWLMPLPFFAVLRGLPPGDAIAVGEALVEAGFRILEVPLNSPDPLASIRFLAGHFGERVLVGAGTVTASADVDAVRAAGGRIVVMPHTDPELVRHAVAAGMLVVPGATTPSECFAALAAGARALKLFPAEILSPEAVRALRAVLPKDVLLFPVGGIAPDKLEAYRRAGADGFGLGSHLYRPGASAREVGERARAFAAAWRALA